MNKANAVFFKMRKHVSLKRLRSFFFFLFFFCYFRLLLIVLLPSPGSKLQHYSKNCNFTKKAIRITNFEPRNCHTSPLFKQNFILNFQDKICLGNILFVSISLNNLSPSFLIHGLVFPQINITMKPQILHSITS